MMNLVPPGNDQITQVVWGQVTHGGNFQNEYISNEQIVQQFVEECENEDSVE